MLPEQKTKQKILALLSVVLLFLIVGSILFLISQDNKNKIDTLNLNIQKHKKVKLISENLEKIQLSTSTSPEIGAKSFLTMAVSDQGAEKILNQKYPDLVLPIASVTKLMVAVVSLENVNPETVVTATKDYIGLEESAFVLEIDKKYTVNELLANALISSDNDSARLLSSTLGDANFITKMNAKAKELGMTHTIYANVTGLDPKKIADGVNVSSVNDLAKLLMYIKSTHPEILKLTTNISHDFCDINNYCKTVISTDKLLSDQDFKFIIIGGKTGSTDLAGKNLVLLASPLNGITLINIVLGSQDNFTDTTSLINRIIIN